MSRFPAFDPDVTYLTEGGQETELMYKYGHELPEFALYPLLDDARAVADLTGMYTSYLAVAQRFGFVPLIGGLDYRASPDWATKLGISAAGLREYQLRSIQFLHDVAAPFGFERALFAGVVGPRNDAYDGTVEITANEAEDYHSVQLATLCEAGVDLVQAMTFNSVPEAIGAVRAANAVDLPVSVSFMVNPAGNILTGPSLREAVEAVDAEAAPDFFGVNCSHPQEFASSLTGEGWLERMRILRPNASTAEKGALCEAGTLDAGEPEVLGSELGFLINRLPNIDIFGGCCGTWDDHLAATGRRLRPTK
jgi:S-methylmethionine-dependent homocysteine/selenocysteine methylase